MEYAFPTFNNPEPKKSGFEARCLKQLHAEILPGIPWSRVEEECPELTYTEYQKHLVYEGQELPTIQFLGKSSAWELEFSEIFRESIKKYDFFKRWERDDYSAVAFLCIGTPMACIKSDYSTVYNLADTDTSLIVKPYKGEQYIIMQFKSYAQLIKNSTTFNWYE